MLNGGVSQFVPKCPVLSPFVMLGKLQYESFPNFSNFRPEFCPEFCSEFSPNFSRTFRASFRGRRRPEKIHQKSPPFFNAKFPGKHEKNIHKILLDSRQSNRLSSFVPICPRSGPQKKRTNGDKTGHFGTNWETPPFSIYPHLALLNRLHLSLCFYVGGQIATGSRDRMPKRGLQQEFPPKTIADSV